MAFRGGMGRKLLVGAMAVMLVAAVALYQDQGSSAGEVSLAQGKVRIPPFANVRGCSAAGRRPETNSLEKGLVGKAGSTLPSILHSGMATRYVGSRSVLDKCPPWGTWQVLASANGAMAAVDQGMVHRLDAKLGSDKKAASNKGVQTAALDIAKVISEGKADEQVSQHTLVTRRLGSASLPTGVPASHVLVYKEVLPGHLTRQYFFPFTGGAECDPPFSHPRRGQLCRGQA